MLALVTKKIAEYPISQLYSFRDLSTKKAFTVLGEFPVLYPSMTVNITYDVTPKGNNLKSFSIPKSDRNIAALAKRNIDTDSYFARIDLHNKTGISYRDMKYIDNPYEYSRSIAGLEGFKKADGIALALGMSKTDERRLTAIRDKAIELFRGRRQETYTLGEYIDMYRRIEKDGSYPELDLETVIESAKFFTYTVDMKLADKELLEARQYLDVKMRRSRYEFHTLLSKREIDGYLKENTLLKDNQRVALEKLTDTRPTIITGGAGTGKTTTERGIIELYSQFYNPEKICLLAPTGKASRRMSEATGMPATTIHNRLRKTPEDDFVYYDENRKLPYTLFIVDEASMIDTLLMTALLKAIPEQAKLYLIGDCNQLYPVGCGEPFHEMIKNKECEVVTLTHNFRQGENSGILENAENVLAGAGVRPHSDFSINYIKKSEILNFAVEGIQNITPYNEVNSAINKNILLQHSENGVIPLFYKGEYVIALKNTKEFFNGDTGIIEKVDKDEIIIRFADNLVTVERDDFNLIMPAYSLTVHKCQGSEYDEVNIFLPQEATDFVTRRLVYTAITRAKKKVNLYFYAAA